MIAPVVQSASPVSDPTDESSIESRIRVVGYAFPRPTMTTSSNSTQDSRTPSLGRLRWVALLVLFGVGFGVARTGVNALWEREPDGAGADKIAALEATDVPYTTLFVGSSRVFRQVSPEVVDARLAEAGIESLSFNLGVPGMAAIETLEILDRALDVAPDTIRQVVVTPERVRPDLQDAVVTSDRIILWHSFGSTTLALQAVADAEASIGEKADWTYNHLAAMSWNATGLGQALAGLGQVPNPSDPESIGPAGDGFLSLDDWYEIGGRNTRSRLERRSENLIEMGAGGFSELVSALALQAAAAEAASPGLAGYEEDFLSQLRSIVERHGAELVLMVPAGGDDYTTDWLLSAQREGVIDAVIDLNDPRAYPDLFTYDLWYDRNHLNIEGAILFSRHLADQLTVLAGGEPPVDAVAIGLEQRAAISSAIAFEQDGLVKVGRDAYLAVPEVVPGQIGFIALDIADDTPRLGGVLEALVGEAWVVVTPEIAARGGQTLLFDVAAVDPAATSVRIAIVGRAGARIDGMAVLVEPVPDGEWDAAGLERTDAGLTKTGTDAQLERIGGVSDGYAVRFSDETARPGIRLDVVDTDGTVVEGSDVRAADDGWAIAIAPVVTDGASIRLTILGGRGTGILEILGSG